MAPLGIDHQNNPALNSSKQRKIRVLALLRQRGPMTRAELARSSGIAKSSISILVDELLDEGHVHQVRANASNRSKSVKGRPGDLIEIDPSAGAAIGIEISFGKIIGVIGDVSHEVLASHVIEIETALTAKQVLKACRSIVSELLTATRVTPSRILGIGLGINTSIYKTDDESMTFADEIWNEFDIGQKLSEATGFQVHLENSANLGGYAETIWGIGKSHENYLYFKIDQNIDGALVIHQQVVLGSHGGMADFGHLILDPNGPICGCGQNGCLDAYSGFQAMIKQASVALGYEVSPKTFLELVASDNIICKQILTNGAQRLGQGMAYLSRVLNPDSIVIGSSCLDIPPEYMRALTEHFHTYNSKQNAHVRIFNGQLGELAVALGAAAQILNNPLVEV